MRAAIEAGLVLLVLAAAVIIAALLEFIAAGPRRDVETEESHRRLLAELRRQPTNQERSRP